MRGFILFLTSWLLLLTGCSRNDAPSQDGVVQRDRSPESTSGSAEAVAERYIVLFLGNSLAAGYGLSPEEAFPNLIQNKIDAAGLPVEVVNAGVSGETTAGGLARVSWLFQQQIDVLVIELGGNDGLRGIPVAATMANLQAIIDAARAENPKVRIVLCGMKVPPNLGLSFTSRFERIFSALADKNNVALVPFLLEGVAGDPRLNLPDGIHPTPEGHRIIAETVWETLEPVVRRLVAESIS